ncbi:unnamed protein product [Medioppia subpectinata]|uniref:Major facilitator superfamily (MFS) profile domain-containing protein n=1 Tax=Medioppia subpectinata TaxID=1979941 RepID=A0A7R9KDI6_9ACAR|nr:unnamed protein product [Medioppia subpectinata]CAG2100116.1 unnamed protein product [Medioppia subpectinata]
MSSNYCNNHHYSRHRVINELPSQSPFTEFREVTTSLFRNYDQLMATSAKENRLRKVPESFMFQLVFNAWALVETFFFLSGLLVVYITLPMLHKTKGNLNVVLFIFHRLIRIIPSVCGIIAVNFLWPLFSTALMILSQTYGLILNGLVLIISIIGSALTTYYGNLYPTLLSDHTINLESQTYGLILNGLVLIISIIGSALTTYYGNLYPTLLSDHTINLEYVEYHLRYGYFPTFHHFGPYCCGIFVGYFILNTPNNYKIPQTQSIISWIVCPLISLSVLLFTYKWNNGVEPSRVSSILYSCLSRTIWCTGLSWITYVCCIGSGGIVNRMLSHPVFVPLSRLSFGVYLSHLVIIFIMFFTKKSVTDWTHFDFLTNGMVTIILSYVLALVLYFLLEAPFANLEKVIFNVNIKSAENNGKLSKESHKTNDINGNNCDINIGTEKISHNRKETEDKPLVIHVTPDEGWAWVISIACAAINGITFGLVRAYGVIFFQLLDTYKLSRESASWPFCLCTTFTHLSGPVAGMLLSHYTMRTIVFMGGLIAAIGMIMCYFSSSILEITIYIGIIQGFGIGLSFMQTPVILAQYFQKFRATATAISYAGGTIGSFIFPPIIDYILPKYGLNGSFLIIGGILLNSLPFALLLRPATPNNSTTVNKLFIEVNRQLSIIRETKDGTNVKRKQTIVDNTTQENAHEMQNEMHSVVVKHECDCEHNPIDGSDDNCVQKYFEEKSHEDSISVKTLHSEPKSSDWQKKWQRVRVVLTNPLYLILCTTHVSFQWAWMTHQMVIIDFAIDRGLSTHQAVILLSSFAGADLFGRVASGLVADKRLVRKRNIVSVCILLIGFLIFMTPTATTFTVLLVVTIALGFVSGAIIVLFSVLTMDYVGLNRLPIALGTSAFIVGVTTLVRPLVVGYFRDTFHSYDGLFQFVGLLALLAALLWLSEPFARLWVSRDTKYGNGFRIKVIPTEDMSEMNDTIESSSESPSVAANESKYGLEAILVDLEVEIQCKEIVADLVSKVDAMSLEREVEELKHKLSLQDKRYEMKEQEMEEMANQFACNAYNQTFDDQKANYEEMIIELEAKLESKDFDKELEIESLKQTLKEKDQELKEVMEPLVTELNETKHKCEQLLSKLSSVETINMNQKNELDSLTLQANRSQELEKEMVAFKETFEDQKCNYDEKIIELETKFEFKDLEIETLKQTVIEKEQELKEVMEPLESELNESKHKCEQLFDKLSSFETINLNLKNELEFLTQQANTSQELENKMAVYKQAIEDQKFNYEEKIIELENKMVAYRQTFEDQKFSDEKKIIELEAKLECKDLELEIETLRQTVKEKENELKEVMEPLVTELNETKHKCEELLSKLSSVEIINMNQKNELDSLTLQANRSQQLENKMAEYKQTFEDQKSNYEEKIIDLENKMVAFNETFEDQKSSYEKKIIELEDKLECKDLELEIETLKQTVKEKENELKEVMEPLEIELNETKHKYEQLFDKLSSFETINMNLKKELEFLTQQANRSQELEKEMVAYKETFETQKSNYDEKIIELETKFDSKELEIETFKQTVIEKEQELKEVMEPLESELNDSKHKCEQLFDKLSSFETINMNLKKELEFLTQQANRSQELEKEMFAYKQTFENQKSSYETKIIELETKLDSKELEIETLKQSVIGKEQELKEVMEPLESELNETKHKCEQLLSKLSSVETINMNQKKELEFLTQQANRCQELENKMVAYRETFEDQKFNYEEKIIELEAKLECKDLELEIETLKQTVKEKENELNQAMEPLETELNATKHKYEELCDKLSSCETINLNLKKELEFLTQQANRSQELEKRILEFEEQKRLKGRNFELILNQAKIWEKKLTTVESDKESLETKLKDIQTENQKLNEELTVYLDRCRETHSELKNEKLKSDSLVSQWRYYRVQHKKIRKDMKRICGDIDNILDDSIDGLDLKQFIISLKKRFNGEESEDETEENEEICDKQKENQRNDRKQPLGSYNA